MVCSITQGVEGGWSVRAHSAWPKIENCSYIFVRLVTRCLCLVIGWDVTASSSQGLRHMRRVTQLLIQVSL
jgi:hypothetical protein